MRQTPAHPVNKEAIIAAITLAALAAYAFLRLNPSFSGDPTLTVMARDGLFAITALGTLPFAYGILRSIFKGRFGVDIIAIAAVAAALATGETLAGAVILLMLSGGESLERLAEARARHSLEQLLRRAPSVAHRISGAGASERVEDAPVSALRSGNLVLVKHDEIVPIDGVIEDGATTVDESAITGEPLPRSVAKGDAVWSGTRNGDALIKVRASGTFDQSVFSGIIRLVRDAERTKAPTVRLADRYSVVFTIFTFGVAAAAGIVKPDLVTAVLVVATPCPLILAAPIAFIAGMSRSARNGIIVKHGGVFEAVAAARAFFFDKTGTLTFGIPSVRRVTVLPAARDARSERDILRLAASVEEASNHVLARSIVDAARARALPIALAADAKEEVGGGITGTVGGKRIAVGSAAFVGMQANENGGSAASPAGSLAGGGMRIFVSEDGAVIGSIEFSDALRKDSGRLIAKLTRGRVETVLVTGDSEARAGEIAAALGIGTVKARCLPADKVALIKEYQRAGTPVAMVGDGINDAPALAAASVGIALGAHGATAATDSADAVITVDDISKVAELAATSRRTVRIAKQSIFIGIGLSVVAMGFAFFGFLPPVEGALLQEGIDVLVIANALRALR